MPRSYKIIGKKYDEPTMSAPAFLRLDLRSDVGWRTIELRGKDAKRNSKLKVGDTYVDEEHE